MVYVVKREPSFFLFYIIIIDSYKHKHPTSSRLTIGRMYLIKSNDGGLLESTHHFQFFLDSLGGLTSPCGSVGEKVEHHALAAVPHIILFDAPKRCHCVKIRPRIRRDIFPILSDFVCDFVEGSHLGLLGLCSHNFNWFKLNLLSFVVQIYDKKLN